MIKTAVNFFVVFCFLCLAFPTQAQSVDIDLIENNILDRIEYRQELTTGSLTKKNSWRNTSISNFVMLKSSTGTFTHDTEPNSNLNSFVVYHRLASISGYLPGSSNMAGEWPTEEKSIATAYQSFFQPKSNSKVGKSGPIIITYIIYNEAIQTNAWKAGVYTTNVESNQPLSNTYHYISPSSWQMNITVPSFIKWLPNVDSFAQNYTSMSEFSSPNQLDGDLSNFQFSHTLPSFLDIKSQGDIVFTPHGGGPATTIPVSLIDAYGNGLTTKAITSSYQTLNTNAYPVVVGNRTTIPLKLRIKSADVKQYLFKAGTYSFVLDLKARASNGAVEDVKSISFTITTPPFNSISIPSSTDVDFVFQNAADYQQGKSQNMPNHLLVTNNKPFEIYVKSGSPNFSLNGTPTTIPSSIIRIENGNGQTGIIARSLSTTPQAIVSGASPSLNQNISLKYTISAAQAAALLGQSSGATPYLLNVIYSFTNQ